MRKNFTGSMLRVKGLFIVAALCIAGASISKGSKSQATGAQLHGNISVSFNDVDNYAQKKKVWRLMPRIGWGYLFTNSIYVGAELYGVFGKSKHTFWGPSKDNPDSHFHRRRKSNFSLGGSMRVGVICSDKLMPYISLSWERARWSRMYRYIDDETGEEMNPDDKAFKKQEKVHNSYYIPGVGVEVKFTPCLSLRAEYQHSFKTGKFRGNSLNENHEPAHTNQVKRLNLGLTYHI